MDTVYKVVHPDRQIRLISETNWSVSEEFATLLKGFSAFNSLTSQKLLHCVPIERILNPCLPQLMFDAIILSARRKPTDLNNETWRTVTNLRGRAFITANLASRLEIHHLWHFLDRIYEYDAILKLSVCG